jgi:hypothetical protein
MFGVYSLSVADSFAHFAARILPPHQDCYADGILHLVIKCDSSDGTGGFGETTESARDQQFRLDGGRDRKSKRDLLSPKVRRSCSRAARGVNCPWDNRFSLHYMAMLGSIGTAGVPAGSIPFVIVVLISVGINPSLVR